MCAVETLDRSVTVCDIDTVVSSAQGNVESETLRLNVSLGIIFVAICQMINYLQ